MVEKMHHMGWVDGFLVDFKLKFAMGVEGADEQQMVSGEAVIGQ
jgi:hypothetical protein